MDLPIPGSQSNRTSVGCAGKTRPIHGLIGLKNLLPGVCRDPEFEGVRAVLTTKKIIMLGKWSYQSITKDLAPKGGILM